MLWSAVCYVFLLLGGTALLFTLQPSSKRRLIRRSTSFLQAAGRTDCVGRLLLVGLCGSRSRLAFGLLLVDHMHLEGTGQFARRQIAERHSEQFIVGQVRRHGSGLLVIAALYRALLKV